METLILERQTTSDLGTFGVLLRNDMRIAFTCELPWKGNANQISCIPKGNYLVVSRHSPKYGDHWHVTGVPGRDLILIHSGNTINDIKGCILIGSARGEVKGLPAVVNSKTTLTRLLDELPGSWRLEVTGVCG